jgi:UDP-N-acetylglucosamine acyltransferase
MLAGHVSVGRRAFVSGAAGAHQYVRIGAFAMVGGQAHLVRDVPPFVTVDGLSSQVVGLNTVGLRRAGFSNADVRLLKGIYRVIYKSGLNWREIVEKIERDHTEGVGLEMARFLATTTRGITAERAVLPTVGEAREAAREADKAEKNAKAEATDESESIQLRVVDENGASLLPPPSKRRVV